MQTTPPPQKKHKSKAFLKKIWALHLFVHTQYAQKTGCKTAFSAWLLYVKRCNKRHEEKKKETFFCHHSLGLFIKFLPHDFLWSSISVQHMWLLVYVSSCFSFHTSNPCSSSSIPATLSAQVLVKYKCLLPNLWRTILSESGCVAALRSSGRVFFIIFILALSAVAL